MKPRLHFLHAVEVYDLRSVDARELIGIQLAGQVLERRAQGVDVAGRVHVDIVAIRVRPVDPLNRKKDLLRVLLHEQALEKWPCLVRGCACASQPNLFLRAIERSIEALGIDRLEQIVQRLRFEGPQRMMVVRGEEDDVEGARFGRGGEHAEAVDAWHLHVEEDEMGREVAQCRDRLLARAGFADLTNVAVALEAAPHLPPRRRLVVHNQHADHVWYGISTETSRPPPSQFSKARRCSRP